jgi:DNA replicative helicase MCM subunit Mcm2 (Cdc46/Mcm family)
MRINVENAQRLTFALHRILDSDRITREDIARAKVLRAELVAAVATDPLAGRLSRDMLERSEFLLDV